MSYWNHLPRSVTRNLQSHRTGNGKKGEKGPAKEQQKENSRNGKTSFFSLRRISSIRSLCEEVIEGHNLSGDPRKTLLVLVAF